MLLPQKTSGGVPPASIVLSLVSYCSLGVWSQLTVMVGFWLWKRSRPFWTFSFSRMLPQPIIEIVTWAVPLCAGALVAPLLVVGLVSVPPQAASSPRPAAPRPIWPARRRNSRREKGVRPGSVERSSFAIGSFSFELCRLAGGN